MVENYLNSDASIPIVLARRVVVRQRPVSFLSDNLSSFVDSKDVVLDVGKGTRKQFTEIEEKSESIATLDAFSYEGYPSIFFDLSAESLPLALEKRFDVIFLFSILEHVPEPFFACRNVMGMLKPGGTVIGYVPWLFPYHAGRGVGKEEGFEDFWRFSPESLGLLFGTAQTIDVFPKRGRISTALMMLTFSRGRNLWKGMERRLPKLTSVLARWKSGGLNRWQASGYDFVVQGP